MKLYTASCKQQFLEELSKIIINNHLGNFDRLKLILPSGLPCRKLQYILLKKLGPTILPRISSLSELVFENEEIFKIPSEQVGAISKIEEKVILSQIIYQYKKLNYNQLQSLKLANALASLFHEFEIYQVDVKGLADMTGLDKPEHWFELHNFIEHVYKTWKAQVHDLNKITSAEYYRNILQSEINWLNDKNNYLILAGMDAENPVIEKFIMDLSQAENCMVMLPPFPYQYIPAEHKYYIPKIYKMFDIRGITHSKWQKTINDKLLIDSIKVPTISAEIEYIELDNIFHEGEYIALKCRDYLAQNPHNTIAIITHNQQIKNHYVIYLDKYDLSYDDQFGQDLLNITAISLLLIIADLLYQEFNLANFFALLSNPLINNNSATLLRNVILKHNRFAHSLSEINILINNCADEELKKYFRHLEQIIIKVKKSDNFKILLEQILIVAEKLLPDIWQNFPEIVTPLKEIYNIKLEFKLEKPQDFTELLKQILFGGRIFKPREKSSIIIAKAQDICLINHDLVIMSDMNENSYPNIRHNNPWINKDLQAKIGLPSAQHNLDKLFYEFYLNTQNSQIIITRSKKDLSNKSTLPSQFVLTLQKSLAGNLKELKAKPVYPNLGNIIHKEYVTSDIFPEILYATDIELLIKSPYNFYAKKILLLRKIREISVQTELADFGNIFHEIMEEYTKNYIENHPDKAMRFKEIAADIINNSQFPLIYKDIWQTKIDHMASEIIEFDEEQRAENIYNYSEIKGSIKLTINGKQVEIAAIADRILVNSRGQVSIIDYKTGQIPSKQDVLNGVAPQMIIEAIILQEGGFNINLPQNLADILSVNKLIYVKIGSKKPYINVMSIEITPQDIQAHKQGLINLLEYYLEHGQYYIEPCDAKYDDYAILARRLS
ncbi:MAG: PD-(D/E)XK nuclease family protein [Rickettsiaceae bacterium]|nr:PD-(D/E)XK nuclease family protein [Rickettsiaceae bacterium]